jgi:hypothetical protein
VAGARARSSNRVRRIGMLMPGTESDQDGQSRVTAFQQGLAMPDGPIIATFRSTIVGARSILPHARICDRTCDLRPDVLFAGNTTAPRPCDRQRVPS